MFHTLKKLEARTRQLEPFRFVDMVPLTPMDAMPGELGVDEVYINPPAKVTGQTLNIGDEFVGRDRYLWARKTLRLPKHREGCELAIVCDFGETGGGHNSGFESLLYINGQPYQGVDTNHKDVIVDDLAGQEVELTFLLWTGLEGGGVKREQRHRINRAEVGYLHKTTDELYYFSKAIYKTIQLLSEDCTEKHQLSHILDNTYKSINWDDDKFYDSVGHALDSLLTALDKLEKHSGVTVNVVGHTHIDVAWLWRLKHTREKAIRSFSTVLRLMEEFDEYIFLQSQPQLYEYVKNDHPQLYEKIKARIADGRWEPDGGMWVEADCNIPSGEALVRQIIHGTSFFREEFGKDCEYLWLPDVFGYSWALPQILKLAGIKTFATTKISWNQYNPMPHDLFKWRGIDGSEILTYFLTTPDVETPENSNFATYNAHISPRSVLGSWHKFKDKPLSNQTLISYGFGDGGGGVNRNMLKMRRVMDKLPGLPNVKPTTAGSFFRRLHESIENTDQYLHVWDGELYLEYHRGTYTSQAKNKLYNRRLEFEVSQCEWAASLAWLNGVAYPAKELYEAWECILLHQFHDIIPGSSIREVYEDSDKAYAKTQADVQSALEGALKPLVSDDKSGYTLFHSGSFSRRDLVLIQRDEDGVFADTDGKTLSAQRTKGGWLVSVNLLALSMKSITFSSARPEEQPPCFTADMSARTLETPLYTLGWDNGGNLTSLYDKCNRREVLAGPANVFEVYEDKPLAFDNWDIDIYYTQKRETAAQVSPPELLENGAERCVLRFGFDYNRSKIRQDVILYKDSSRIDFVTDVKWQENDRLLKVAFPVNIRATKASYDIQFGHVERPTHYNTSWDYARFEVVGHKWADISESNYGVSLLNDCKYGYNIKDNILRLTLLKSTKHPDPEMDMGDHRFTYALLPHRDAVSVGNTIEESIKLNLPVQVVPGQLKSVAQPLVSIDSNAVIVDAIKKADKEDCIILRVHECRGTHTEVKIETGKPLKAFVVCNLLEENLAPKTEAPKIETVLRPFEIKTFKLWF